MAIPTVLQSPPLAAACGSVKRNVVCGDPDPILSTSAGCAVILAHELGHALHPDDDDPLGVD